MFFLRRGLLRSKARCHCFGRVVCLPARRGLLRSISVVGAFCFNSVDGRGWDDEISARALSPRCFASSLIAPRVLPFHLTAISGFAFGVFHGLVWCFRSRANDVWVRFDAIHRPHPCYFWNSFLGWGGFACFPVSDGCYYFLGGGGFRRNLFRGWVASYLVPVAMSCHSHLRDPTSGHCPLMC